jgi:hypothetical protein
MEFILFAKKPNIRLQIRKENLAILTVPEVPYQVFSFSDLFLKLTAFLKPHCAELEDAFSACSIEWNSTSRTDPSLEDDETKTLIEKLVKYCPKMLETHQKDRHISFASDGREHFSSSCSSDADEAEIETEKRVEKSSPVRKTSSPGQSTAKNAVNVKSKSGMILKNTLEKPGEGDGVELGQQQVFASKSFPVAAALQSEVPPVVGKKVSVPASPPKKKSTPPKKQQQQQQQQQQQAKVAAAVAASALMQLTPVEPSSAPQPIEQDVVISTSEPLEKSQANQLYCLCKQPYDDSQ